MYYVKRASTFLVVLIQSPRIRRCFFFIKINNSKVVELNILSQYIFIIFQPKGYSLCISSIRFRVGPNYSGSCPPEIFTDLHRLNIIGAGST